MIPLPEGQTPRRWQVEAWEAIRRGLALKRSVLVSAATGTGKGTLLAGLCAAWAERGERVLFLVHREELVRDIAARIGRLGVEAGIVMGKQKDVAARVVCASVASLRKPTLERVLEAGPVAWVLTDEAHHAPAPGYQRVYRTLAAQEAVTLRHVGVTATPYRHDADGGTSGLGGVYEALVYEYGILDAIRDGVLCRVVAEQIVTGTDLCEVRLDDDAAVEAAVDGDVRNRQIVRAWLDKARGRPTVGFAAGVEHARHLAECFRAEGARAEAVWGEDRDRAAKVAALRAGKLDVLWNCALFTEGFDAPEISCVLLARPTASAGLYAQMVGRGLRTAPGKEDCLLLDFVDLTERLELQTAANLLESAVKVGPGEYLQPGDRVEHRHDPKRYDGNVVSVHRDMVGVGWLGREDVDLCYRHDLRRVRPEVDGVETEYKVLLPADGPVTALTVVLFAGRPEGWYHYRDSRGADRYTIAADGSRCLQLVREAPGLWSAWEIYAGKVYGGNKVFPLAQLIPLALDWIPWRPRPWSAYKEGPLSPAQLRAIRQWGIRRDVTTLSRGEASALITTKIAMALIQRERTRRRGAA